MVCGSKAFKGHRRAFDSWFIWIIIKIMPFGPSDSDVVWHMDSQRDYRRLFREKPILSAAHRMTR
jgi:hypothetical protein